MHTKHTHLGEGITVPLTGLGYNIDAACADLEATARGAVPKGMHLDAVNIYKVEPEETHRMTRGNNLETQVVEWQASGVAVYSIRPPSRGGVTFNGEVVRR